MTGGRHFFKHIPGDQIYRFIEEAHRPILSKMKLLSDPVVRTEQTKILLKECFQLFNDCPFLLCSFASTAETGHRRQDLIHIGSGVDRIDEVFNQVNCCFMVRSLPISASGSETPVWPLPSAIGGWGCVFRRSSQSSSGPGRCIEPDSG